MGFPIDIIIRVDAKKENDSGEYTFQCKALGELVRYGDQYHYYMGNQNAANYIAWKCGIEDGKDGAE